MPVRHHPAAYCLFASDSGKSDGWTPLCAACEEGSVEVVMALVGAGAALHHTTVRHRGQGRRGPISLQTVSCGYFFMRCWFLHVSVQSEGETPLCIASRNGHVDVVRALVRAGAVVDQTAVRDRRMGPLQLIFSLYIGLIP
jgi:ankyrin repeat protein